MVDVRRRKVSVAGSGKISSGVYESVRIIGAGKIDGDVEAKTISTAGSCEIEGSAKAEKLRTAGACEVTGSITAGEMKTAGDCSVEGDVKADLFKCAGSQRIGGWLSAKYVGIAGVCRIGEDVEADKFIFKGSFRIAGLLSADEIDICLRGKCRVREIGGERISVRRKIGGWFTEIIKPTIHAPGPRILETELIEEDEILLEWTMAKTVRGKQVVIGEGCEIERVEYCESLEVDESAKVEERVKL